MDHNLRCELCRQVAPVLTRGMCPKCVEESPTVPPVGKDRPPTEQAAASSVIAEQPGAALRKLGDYELQEEIARGGMGVVYLARHVQLNRTVALKMVLGGRFSSNDEIQRFQFEAEAAAKLDHPGIVPVYDIGEHEGQAYFAMKLVDGGSLAERLPEFARESKQAVGLIRKIAEAISHAHQRGVLHRDLKPANILIDRTGEPLVTDFGLAKDTASNSGLTQSGAILGTPAYMPPEQACGSSVTMAADIYSLGAIFYELLTGRPPYTGDSPLEVVMQVIEGEPVAPRKINSSVESELELMCLKCMHREPEQRYATAREFATDLEAWQLGRPISVKPQTWSAVASRWVRRNQQLVYLSFAILIGVLSCFPLALSFVTNSEATEVYSYFPEEQRPWMFSESVPEAVQLTFVGILIFGLWPAIGLVNAAISLPRSVLGACGRGLLTSVLMSILFFILLGWMVFLQGASNTSRGKIRGLARAVWPTGESQAESMERANQLFEGLEEIPEDRRADIVASRILHDQYASAPTSFLVGLLIVSVFSFPIVFGTVIGYVLLQRQLSSWLLILRYLICWASLFGLCVVGFLAVLGNIDGTMVLVAIPIWVCAASAILLLVFYAAVRRWSHPFFHTQGTASSET